MAKDHIKTNAEIIQEGYLLHIQFEKVLKALKKGATHYPNFEELEIEFYDDDATFEHKASMIERLEKLQLLY